MGFYYPYKWREKLYIVSGLGPFWIGFFYAKAQKGGIGRKKKKSQNLSFQEKL